MKIRVSQWWALSVQMWYSSWSQQAAQRCSNSQPGAEPRKSPQAGWVEDGLRRDFWGRHHADPKWSQRVTAHSHIWQNKALALRAVKVWLGVGTCSWFHPLKEVDILSKVPRKWLKVLILLALLIPILHTLFEPPQCLYVPLSQMAWEKQQELPFPLPFSGDESSPCPYNCSFKAASPAAYTARTFQPAQENKGRMKTGSSFLAAFFCCQGGRKDSPWAMEVGRVPVRPFSAGQPCWCAVEQELASTHKANLLPIAGELQKG